MEIKKFAVTNHFVKALVYGSSGSGKTTFAGTATNAIFASAEGGLMSIADIKPDFVEIKSLKELTDLLSYLKTQKHPYQTVIIDSISEINEIIKIEIKRKTGKAMQLQDWGDLAEKIRAILRGFRDLPMHVLFLAQENCEMDDQKIVKVVPQLNGKAATEIAYFMDIVGYLSIAADGSRHLLTESNSKYLTKDRSGVIGNDCPIDFTEWMNRISKIELGEQAVQVTYAGQKQKPTRQQAMEHMTGCLKTEPLQVIYDQIFTYEWKPDEATELSECYFNCFKKLSPTMLFNGMNEMFDDKMKMVGAFVKEPNGKVVLKKIVPVEAAPEPNPEEQKMEQDERAGMKSESASPRKNAK